MTLHPAESLITDLQWLKIHLRVAALEQNGSRLNCRFEFPEHTDNITCHIYFTDDDSNSMQRVSQDERIEIYEGWVFFATSVIRRGLELAELPSSFVWNPIVQFILYEARGMGGAIVHKVTKSFRWPESSGNPI